MTDDINRRVLRSSSRSASVTKSIKNTITPKKLSFDDISDSKVLSSSSVTSSSYTNYQNGFKRDRREVTKNSIRTMEGQAYDTKSLINDSGITTTPFSSTPKVLDEDSINVDSHRDHSDSRYKSNEEILSYYKGFGDWWNYFPKTDNTYNQTSKWYGKEVAPGIPVLPNMARRPLRHTPPVQYQQFSNSSDLSEDTVDGNDFPIKENISWFRKFTSIVTTVFTTIWTFITFNKSDDRTTVSKALNYSYDDDNITKNDTWSVFRWLYKLSMWSFFQEVLLFERMHSKFSKVKSRKENRALKFLFVILIPLLLALIVYYVGPVDKLKQYLIYGASAFNYVSLETIMNYYNYIFQSTQ